MIYISTACVRHGKIVETLCELASHGFKNIELSGGTSYYEEYESDLFRLKEKYGLNYLVHNYFPPPQQEDFVINLASLDDSIYQRSIEQLKEAIQLSKSIGADKFGFHAGYFVDVQVDDLGRTFSKKLNIERNIALDRFCAGFMEIAQAAGGVDLYLENNVYSYSNYRVYEAQIPLMLLHYNDYLELQELIDFKLLLDIGHLNVTIASLDLNRDYEFRNMISVSDYIHLSENDGKHDQNRGLEKDGFVLNLLKKYNMKDKIVTLEINGGIDSLKRSYNLLLSEKVC